MANVAHADTRSDDDVPSAPRSRKGHRTRAPLVDAAKTVFERDGFLDARIVDIAATAKLAPGSFYHYFDSKEEIFREVAELQEERLTAPPEHAPGRRPMTRRRSSASAARTGSTSSGTGAKRRSWA